MAHRINHNLMSRAALTAALAIGCAAPAAAQKVGAVAPKRTAAVPPHNADTFGHYSPQWRRWPHDWQQPVVPRSQAAPKPAEPSKPAEDVPKPDSKKPVDEMPPPPTKEPEAPPSAAPTTPDEAPLTAPPTDEAPLTDPMDDAMPPLELEPPEEPAAMPDDDSLPLDTDGGPAADGSLPLDTEAAPGAEPEGLDDLPPLDLDDGAPAAPPGVGDPQSRYRAPGRRAPVSPVVASRTQRGGIIGRWPLKTVLPAVAAPLDNRQPTVGRQLRRGDAVAPSQQLSVAPKAPRKFTPAGEIERLPRVEPPASNASRRQLAARPNGRAPVEQASWTAAEAPKSGAAVGRPTSPADPKNPLRKSSTNGWQPPSGSRLQSNPLRSAG